MANIVFFEKPGCINNEKQKKVLMDAGHTLECKNILQHPWSKEELLRFVSGKEPTAMMNHTAPDIKSGKIIPEKLEFLEALDLMLATPLLIKRPLISVDDLYLQGFTEKELQPYLGDWDGKEDIVTCPNLRTVSCDDQ